jgi:hypothetical protein
VRLDLAVVDTALYAWKLGIRQNLTDISSSAARLQDSRLLCIKQELQHRRGRSMHKQRWCHQRSATNTAVRHSRCGSNSHLPSAGSTSSQNMQDSTCLLSHQS